MEFLDIIVDILGRTGNIYLGVLFGFIFKHAPASAGVSALLLSVPVYGFLHLYFRNIAFLNRMAAPFIIICIVMAVITYVKPLKEPKVM